MHTKIIVSKIPSDNFRNITSKMIEELCLNSIECANDIYILQN